MKPIEEILKNNFIFMALLAIKRDRFSLEAAIKEPATAFLFMGDSKLGVSLKY